MKGVLSFLLIFQLSIPGFASDCPESVTLIEKGATAQCTGFLFSPEAEAQAAQDNADSKYYKLTNEKLVYRQGLQEKQNEILDKRLKLYMDQSHVLAQELQRKESNSKWENVLWFSLGIIATGVAVYGAGRLK